MTWITNTWYVACSADEIKDKPLGRTICGVTIVFYRGEGGKVGAVEDFCPHRGAKLSLGRVVDGRLVCGYHGLEMGCDGKTIAMPGQRIQGFTPIRSFPVVERYGFVWIWPGEASRADPATIHHLAWADSAEWAYGGGLFHIRADYRLMIDNLMDLTHERYVHADSIGQKEIDEVVAKTRLEGDEVITSRYMDNVSAPPLWRMVLRGNGLADDVPVDRWQVCRFTPPSHVMIEVGVAHAGKGGYDADPANKVYSIVVDFITPETETSMWYFWGSARRFKPKDAALTDMLREGQRKVFSEDLAVLEAQQQNHLAHPGRRLMRLPIDTGGVRARMVIERLRKQESEPVPESAT